MKRTKSHRPKRATAKRAAKSSRRSRPQAAAKTKTPDTIDALVAVNAKALGLTIAPAWHHGVAFNLRLILQLGALVDDFRLPDDAEPAPVFHA
jgi:Protein of unknown function (DUF4089)